MLFLDPPQHTRVRAALARAFTPATLAALRPRIELICRTRLDRIDATGQMELIGDLAYPLPVIVIAELLGFPAEDYEKFKQWSDDMTASLALNATAEQHAAAAEARDQIRQYFDQIVLLMRSRPSDSLISRLLESEDSASGLSREEIFTNSVLLLAAGHETTTNLIGNGVLALMRNRDQWEQLVADPALIESAVEEMLRYDCPVQWTSRLCHEQTEFAGQTIEGGRIILGCVGAANRDPAKFADPDRFDIRRADNKHLSFGTGVHFCLGAALARMEAQIALSMLIERYPQMKWSGRKLHWNKGLTFRGVRSLPLTLR
jgi:cytochrome P450